MRCHHPPVGPGTAGCVAGRHFGQCRGCFRRFFRSFRSFTARFLFARWRCCGDEVGAEQVGDAGVVVEPELVLLRRLVDARAASDHLIERDARLQVAKEHHRVEPLDVHAGGQQIDGAGDKAAFARAAHLLDQIGAALCGALERVVILRRRAVLAAPGGIPPLHLHCNAVGVQVARTEDDDFLLRSAVLAQPLEKVLAHRSDALGQHDVVVEVLRDVLGFHVFGFDVLSGSGIDGVARQHLVTGEGAPVDGGFELDDFAGGKVAVFLGFDQRVLVDWVAEVVQVVSRDVGVIARLVF